MDTNYDQIQAGWSAHGSDGDKIGDIEEVGQNYLLVTKGLIFPKDLYIPQSAIGNVDTDQGQVFLNVEKSQVDDMGWNEPPEAGDWATGGVAGGGSAVMNNDVTTGDTTGAVDSGGYSSDYGSTGGTEYATGTTGTTDYATTTTTGSTGYATGGTDYGTETSGDTMRVPVHQEELRAERTSGTTGEVRVDKDIVEEQRTLDVPVTREEVEIRRVPVDSTARADDTAFTGGDTIRVPVSAEQIQVSKDARVVEEIEISKRPVTETQTITDTVRREQVNVDETGGVLGGSGTTMGATGTAGNEAYVGSGSAGVRDTGYTGDAGYTGDDRGDRSGDRSGGREVGAEAAGAGGGALGGAAIGGLVGGPPGAVIGGVVGAAGGALAGESAEGGDEKGGAAAGGGAGAVAGAVVGGVVGGPPGAVVGGAVGAGAGSGIGDQAQEGDDDETTRR